MKETKALEMKLSYQRTTLRKLRKEKGVLERNLKRAQNAYKAFIDEVPLEKRFEEMHKKVHDLLWANLSNAKAETKKPLEQNKREIISMEKAIRLREKEIDAKKTDILDSFKKEHPRIKKGIKVFDKAVTDLNRIKKKLEDDKKKVYEERMDKLFELKKDLDGFINEYSNGSKRFTKTCLKISKVLSGFTKILPKKIRADVEKLKTAIEIQKNCDNALAHVDSVIGAGKDVEEAARHAMQMLSKATVYSQQKLKRTLNGIYSNKREVAIGKLADILKSKEHTLRDTFGIKPK